MCSECATNIIQHQSKGILKLLTQKICASFSLLIHTVCIVWGQRCDCSDLFKCIIDMLISAVCHVKIYVKIYQIYASYLCSSFNDNDCMRNKCIQAFSKGRQTDLTLIWYYSSIPLSLPFISLPRITIAGAKCSPVCNMLEGDKRRAF